MKNQFASVVLTLAMSAVCGVASAQDFTPSYSPSFTSDMNSAVNMGIQLRRDSERPRGTSSRSTASSSAASRVGSTTYRSSPAVTQRVKQQFADFVGRSAGQQGATDIATALARGDAVASWAGIVRSDGLRPGDLADSMAAYWVLNWVIANQSNNNRVQTIAARDQLRGIIASNANLSRLSDAERQEMSEALMLNFLVQHAAYTNAIQAGDNAAMRRLGDAAVARFRSEAGVNLRNVQLTNTGFTPSA